jgi:hypothetical protein
LFMNICRSGPARPAQPSWPSRPGPGAGPFRGEGRKLKCIGRISEQYISIDCWAWAHFDRHGRTMFPICCEMRMVVKCFTILIPSGPTRPGPAQPGFPGSPARHATGFGQAQHACMMRAACHMLYGGPPLPQPAPPLSNPHRPLANPHRRSPTPRQSSVRSCFGTHSGLIHGTL